MPSPLDQAYDLDAFQTQAAGLARALAGYLERALGEELPVLARQDPEELLARTPALGGVPQGDLLSLAAQVLEHSTHVHHPGFIGHQVSVPPPQAILWEALSSLLANGMAIFEMGQLQTVMERRVVEFLCGALGFGPDASGVLTHGGSLGNLTALLAARQAKAGYDVWSEGQREPLGVLVSEQAHYCIARSVQVMGWGARGAWAVPTDERFRLRPEALESQLRRAQGEGRRILAVVASSCSTASGSFDPLPEVAAFCREHDLWLHVDGAHGASLVLSERHRTPLRGVELADSVVWDLHKLLALPALSTAVLYRDGARSYEAFAQEASYLFDGQDREQEWFQIGRRTLECTKRALSVPAYGLLATLGRAPFVENVERLVDRAQGLAARLEAAPDFELAAPPEANILCFRHRQAGLAGEALDAHQLRLRQALIAGGRYYLTQARLAGAQWLRVTVQNPATTDEHLARLLPALRELA